MNNAYRYTGRNHETFPIMEGRNGKSFPADEFGYSTWKKFSFDMDGCRVRSGSLQEWTKTGYYVLETGDAVPGPEIVIYGMDGGWLSNRKWKDRGLSDRDVVPFKVAFCRPEISEPASRESFAGKTFGVVGGGYGTVPVVVFENPEAIDDLKAAAGKAFSAVGGKTDKTFPKCVLVFNEDGHAITAPLGRNAARYEPIYGKKYEFAQESMNGQTFVTCNADEMCLHFGATTLKGRFTDGYCYPFMWFRSSGKVLVGNGGWSHGTMMYEMNKSGRPMHRYKEEMLGKAYGPVGRETDEDDECDMCCGRVFVLSPRYTGKKLPREKLPRTDWFRANFPDAESVAVIAMWEDEFRGIGDRKMTNIAKKAFRELLNRHGNKVGPLGIDKSRFVFVWNDTVYAVDLDSNKPVAKTVISAEREKELAAAKAIHLAGQDDKRTYFKKFRQERDSRNQEVYNHTPSKTEAEYRWMNTIGDSVSIKYDGRKRLLERKKYERWKR